MTIKQTQIKYPTKVYESQRGKNLRALLPAFQYLNQGSEHFIQKLYFQNIISKTNF